MTARTLHPRGRAWRAALGFAFLLLAAIILRPSAAQACACGCGVFDVGASTVFPNDGDHGLAVWTRFGGIDQMHNWSGTRSAPAETNADRKIRTQFYTLGAQYMINNDWGVMAEVPMAHRSFGSTDDGGNPTRSGTTGLGDVTILGMYTGLSDDGSTGLLFGLSLPTGQFGARGFDRDTQVGTGATQAIVGGYHLGGLNADNSLAYYVQARYQVTVAMQDHYHPGSEAFVVGGLTYNFGEWGPFSRIAPVVQAIYQHRESDKGANAFPGDTGFNRVLMGPGLDLRVGRFRLFTDVAFPVHQWVRGNQLVSSVIYKAQLGYLF
jgi:hypothetical protein